jgi:hypothetical protein
VSQSEEWQLKWKEDEEEARDDAYSLPQANIVIVGR